MATFSGNDGVVEIGANTMAEVPVSQLIKLPKPLTTQQWVTHGAHT